MIHYMKMNNYTMCHSLPDRRVCQMEGLFQFSYLVHRLYSQMVDTDILLLRRISIATQAGIGFRESSSKSEPAGD